MWMHQKMMMILKTKRPNLRVDDAVPSAAVDQHHPPSDTGISFVVAVAVDDDTLHTNDFDAAAAVSHQTKKQMMKRTTFLPPPPTMAC